jgi:hypothetical protein
VSGHRSVAASKGFPNITSTQLFEELCIQFPGHFHAWQVRCLMKRVKAWRQDARARGGDALGNLTWEIPQD